MLKSIEDLRAFYRLTNVLLSQNFKFKTKLKKALNIILSHVASERGSIMLIKEEKFLTIIASTEKSLENLKIDINKRNSPAVVSFKEKKIVKGEVKKPLHEKYKCKYYVIFPIKVKDKVYGVITITNKKNDIPYSEKEIKIIEKFINSISILIENVYLHEEIIETSKLKEELTSMIIHDLKSPLSQIIANLDLLMQRRKLDEEDYEIIDTAMQGCEDLKRMILNLLDIYKMENGKLNLELSREDLNSIINEVLEKFKGLIKIKEQKLIKRFDKKICFVNVDKDLISRVFSNLIHNAIKYSPIGEKIIVTTRCKNSKFYVTIKNTGVGIEKDKLKYIFEKFYSTYKKHESSGLGLTFCKMAIEAHNGEIKVSSKPNEWTKFTVILPVVERVEINEEIFKITV